MVASESAYLAQVTGPRHSIEGEIEGKQMGSEQYSLQLAKMAPAMLRTHREVALAFDRECRPQDSGGTEKHLLLESLDIAFEKIGPAV